MNKGNVTGFACLFLCISCSDSPPNSVTAASERGPGAPSFEVISASTLATGELFEATRLGELMLEGGVVSDGRILVLRESCSACADVLWNDLNLEQLPDIVALVPDAVKGPVVPPDAKFVAALTVLQESAVQIVELPARSDGYVVSVPLEFTVENGRIVGADQLGR